MLRLWNGILGYVLVAAFLTGLAADNKKPRAGSSFLLSCFRILMHTYHGQFARCGQIVDLQFLGKAISGSFLGLIASFEG